MLRTKNAMVGLLTAALLVIGAAGQAQAQQVLDATAVGSQVWNPFVVGDGKVTVQSITNVSDNTAAWLHVNVIDGSDWSAIDFPCHLTPNETGWMVFETGASPTSVEITVECSVIPGFTETRFAAGPYGVVVATAVDQGGLPIQHPSGLSSDWVILDFDSGYAASAPAVHVQALNPMPPNRTDAARPGQRITLYDGVVNYAHFPAAITTNVISPDQAITAELILFTPDGEANSGPGINVRLGGAAYDDDEDPISGFIEFDCFAILDIRNPAPNGFDINVDRRFGGTFAGNIQLTVNAVSSATDLNELLPPTGDNNGVRFRPAMGWLLQTIAGGGTLDDGAYGDPNGMADNAAWARIMTHSTDPHPDLGADLAGLVTQ